MSLNDIRLTPQLLTELYGTVLVEIEKPPAAPVPAIGGNDKKILILAATAGEAVLPEGNLQFLTSILSACKLTLDDVAIVNWNRTEHDHAVLLTQFESRFVLLFGLTPPDFGLPMNFPAFQVQPFDSQQYLCAPVLAQIQESKALKTELWNALKKLFLL